MGWLIRTLLIWLLVLAVPAQGAAAATMTFCGPDHHGGGAAATQQAAPAAHAHHGSDADSAHEHVDIAGQADEETSAAASSAASAKSGHASQSKCSACASCCSFGAILSTVLAVPAPVVAPTVFCAVVPSVDTFAADGPDRPPRIVLA
jgi:hypothetical protein